MGDIKKRSKRTKEKEEGRRSSNEEIHIHILDDLLPIPTLFNIGIHHLPHPLDHPQGWLDVAEVGIRLEGIEPLLDALSLLRYER